MVAKARTPSPAAPAAVVAIDVHAHFGTYVHPDTGALESGFMSGDPALVVERARQAGTGISVVSPLLGLLPRGQADAVAGNDEAARAVAKHAELRQWAVVHPLQPETFAQARKLLATPQCVGIKIHPEEHRYPIVEHGRGLFEFAAEQGAAIMAHSGEELSQPLDFVPFANTFESVSLILAHLGNSGSGSRADLQVRAIQEARHGNVYTDTSSARSIMPGLIEWAARQIGADRLLYGTDSPLYFAPMQRARIDAADLGDADKRNILRDNAIRVLRRL
jgi:predicted TIM-barrel fold metal-dependent hydrolase